MWRRLDGTKLARRDRRRRGPAVIVSVDYRLAPEHHNPAAYDDAFASLKAVVAACRPDGLEPWLAAHGDASPVVLAGENLKEAPPPLRQNAA
ncbi:hypothetical protein QYE76_069696 [Lolium multiflorum]|uniref:Alpha/beta hydrolase fold-3 domain-containing protein n=1 Tax=Lolium multiflorum TaxID=4521 RepID=A0AAD8SGT9_LOLMU|nr:hypothetical protein QYE76_069696 [Lolium multiflorum]